jgi:hypothetical protein
MSGNDDGKKVRCQSSLEIQIDDDTKSEEDAKFNNYHTRQQNDLRVAQSQKFLFDRRLSYGCLRASGSDFV